MTISSTNRRAGPYSGNSSQTAFPFSFKVFEAADMLVVKVEVATNIETTLTLTTDYTVALNADQNSNAGGTINLVTALPTGYNMVISSKVAYLQETDLTNQGGFYPEVITDALDRLTIEAQQLKEGLDRAAQLPITSSADAAALVADIERIASSADNLDTVATNITSVNTVAGSISNVNSVAANISNVNAVAANETNINAVKNNATNINAVNANKTNIDTVAGNNTNVTTVAGISANVTTVAGISSNVTSVAGNATNINAVAGNSTNINAVNANKTNIDAVAGNATNINTVASNNTNINTTVANMAAIIDAPTQAANAANSAAAAAASAASGMYSAVQDKSANYTVVAADAGDLIRVTTTSGAITITLPLIGSTGITDGFKIAVVKWTSDANPVNIARSGSNTINGATSAQIGSQYSQIIFVADAETSTWFASQSGLGATNVNVDVFSGNASTTAFTLSSDPSSKNNTYVSISGVYQAKSTYSVSGTTLTFSTAPPTGTSNIEVVYGTPLAIGTPSDGTVTTAKLVDANVTYAKIQNVTAGKVLGRDTSGAGTVQELPISVDSSGNVTIPATFQTYAASAGINATKFGAGRAGDWVYLDGKASPSASDGYTIFGMRAYSSLVSSDVLVGATEFFKEGSSTDNKATYVVNLHNGTSVVQQLRVASNGDLRFNSGYGSAATAYGCRAWVNFNGTGTVAIRASGNVSSLTDNGVGLYVVNLTSALPDTNGVVMNGGCFSNAQSTTENSALLTNISTTSAIQISAYNTATGGRHDATYVMVGAVR